MDRGSGVTVENVAKLWGKVAALRDVSFEVPAGSLTVLLGASGCGKSTLLRLIAGLDSVSTGRILIGGQDVTAASPSQRRISMVFQNYALFPHLSVADNILFGLQVRKTPRAECQARLARVAALLGLRDLLGRRPAQLSGGQQQRVAMGRAIVAGQPVCLMDEPMSNLDAQLRAEMRGEILSLQRELGITMLYVTHDQIEAMSMADQVVLLNRGAVEQIAPPARMYADPATIFAARFIGTPPMNLLLLEPAASGQAHVIAGTEHPVQGGVPGRAMRLGLRPEDVRLAAAGVDAEVVRAEFLGADTVVTCRVAAQTVLVRVPRLLGTAPGDLVHLAWDPDAERLFDEASGHAVAHATTQRNEAMILGRLQ